MIDKLTKEQEARLPEFRDKWLRIGLCTAPIDREKAGAAVSFMYKCGGLKPPKEIIWTTSPLANAIICSYIKDKNVRASVWDSVLDSVRDNVFDNVFDSVGASVFDSVRDNVFDNVFDSVGDSVLDSVRDNVFDSVGDSVLDSVGDSVYGQHDAPWLAFYEYFKFACGLVSQTKKVDGLIALGQNANWCIPFKNVCIVSERHNTCKLKDGVIHADGGPAVAYPDGFSIWALHGVRVSREIAETPAKELDPKLILKEKNAEVRREIVRKVGVERVCEKLGAKCIDRQDTYELLMLDLGDGRSRPYLKMRNPSIGIYHIEGVHPDCNTVEKALNFRNGRSESPVTLA